MAVSEAGERSRLGGSAPFAIGGVALAAAVVGLVVMNQPQPAPASTEAPAASRPAGQDTPPPTGGGLAGVQFDQATPSGIPPGVRPSLQQDMEIVVKFKDDGKIKDIVDAFWKDQASARQKFEALKARRPELANLKLDRVTYSNELVLVHEGGAPPDRRLAAMREIAAKLKSAADISYAEPNMTAHPGGQ
jgi:hypothetical protein